MTTHSKLAVALTALVLGVMALAATQAAPPAPTGGPGMQPPTSDQIVAGMAKMLGLSKAQQAKLRPIYAAQAKQMKALWDSKSAAMGQNMSKVRAIQKATDRQMRKVLTPAQIRKLDDVELDGLTRYLGLSEAQRTKIRPIIASRNRKLEALPVAAPPDGHEQFAKAGAILQSSQKQIRAVLTTAQKRKLDQAMQGMGGAGGGGGAGGKPPR